jgi:lambda repressor-like predicted transcriptional regulator
MPKVKRKSKAMPTYNARNLLALYSKDKNNRFLADVFGVSRATIIRWVNRPEESDLNIFKADHYACRIGMHPATIWSDWYEKQEEYYGK